MGRADRTASLEAENARLRERLRLLDDAIESIGHGLCVFAPDRRIAVCNRRYAEVLDLAPEEVRPGRSLGDLVRQRLENDAYEPGRDAAEIEADLWARFTTRGQAPIQVEHGGRPYEVRCHETDAGNIVAMFEDISGRLQAESALRESEARLRAILNTMPDSVKIFDQTAELVYVNPRGLELIEAPDLATFVASGFVAVPPEHLAEWLQIHARVIAGETTISSHDVVGLRGQRRHVETHSVPIRLPDGSRGHMCISRDVSERKTAEDALRRSERRLRLIQSATGLAEFETDTVGITSSNGRFFEQVGLPPQSEPMTFEQWLERVHPDDREHLHEQVLRSMQDEDSIDCEFRVIRADTGEVRWLATHTGVERDEDGELIGTIGAHLDITDRKRAEEALRESEARLSAILEAMPDCVKLFDENFGLTYINPRGLKLLEAPDLQTFNASGHVPVPPEYLPQCADVHGRVIAGEPVVWTYEIIGMKGARRHVEAHSVPFRMPDGAPAHMCISRDVSERKTAEDALRRSEQRLRLIQEITGFADFETDANGLMVASDRFFDQIGLPMAEGPIEGKEWAKHVHPADIGWLVQVLDRAIADRCESFGGEFRIVRADTTETRWLASSTKMEYAEDGALVRTIGAHLDITDRKRAEEALRASEQRLRLVQEATGLADFEAGLDGVAHVSEALIAQLGLPPGTTKLPFDELLQYVHPDDRAHLQREIERSLASEETFQGEFRIVHGVTGEVRWIYSRTMMERDEAGTPVRSIGAHLDITDRKRAEEALRESEERFRLAAEAAGLGVWDYDAILEQ
ncbi:MAG TPA: PAS domain S-box protein, partial [Croceibacterium sp.]